MNIRTVLLVLGIVSLASVAQAESADNTWPTWRGTTPNGISENGTPPTTWSETENIKWKLKIPGTGSSTPVIWGNKMFLQTAVPVGEPAAAPTPPPETEGGARQGRRRGFHRGPQPTQTLQFKLICVDRSSGEILWDRTLIEAVPHEGHHQTGDFAPYSPVTDGEHVWASFGSRGLYCYDLDGNQIWSAELIKMNKRNRFGEGSSPALAGDAIVVLMDHEGQSKISAFNKDTGKLLWGREREEMTSWTTPVPVEVNGRLEVITCATNLIRSYDVETGELIWQCSGQTLNTIPSPLLGFGNVYCTSGFRGHALQAIELGNEGDLSGSDAIQWQTDQGTPYVASPILYDDRIYFLADLKGVLSCYDAKTGKPYYADIRLEGLRTVYASLVGAGGHVYATDRSGTTVVIKHSDTFSVVATNKLDDGFDASPVVIGDELYMRGDTYLYCIAKS